jgi:hypothetical protein
MRIGGMCRERAMRKAATLTIAIMIMPAILWARSDDIPNLDVRPVCRGIASQSASNPTDVGIKTTFDDNKPFAGS